VLLYTKPVDHVKIIGKKLYLSIRTATGEENTHEFSIQLEPKNLNEFNWQKKKHVKVDRLTDDF
jgi:hypothetical protein